MKKPKRRKYPRILKGERFGLWLVLADEPEIRVTRSVVPARCECGVEGLIDVYSLLRKGSEGCRACRLRDRARVKVSPGDVYGHWTVKRLRFGGNTRAICCCGLCGCDRSLFVKELVTGRTTRCQACSNREKAAANAVRSRRTRQTPQFRQIMRVLRAAQRRCQNPDDPNYKGYGGRGITFEFETVREGVDWILEKLGPRPSGKSLDRIDNDAGYARGNLRWATDQEQRRNTRRACYARNLEVGGVPARIVRRRLTMGWSFERAVYEAPSLRGRPRSVPVKDRLRGLKSKPKAGRHPRAADGLQFDLFGGPTIESGK